MAGFDGGSWVERRSKFSRSEVEEARAAGFGWERTALVAAEEAIAVARYEAVGPIPECAREKLHHSSEKPPDSSQVHEDEVNRVGTREQ
jgi:hypothetical protein